VDPARRLGPIRFAFRADGAGQPVGDGAGQPVADGAGRSVAGTVVVPAAGTWSLTVQVRTDATTDYSATLTYHVG
jgi:hypothetical protein